MDVFTAYDWIYGISQLAAAFLSVAALTLTLVIYPLHKRPEHRAWNYVLVAIILFGIEAVLAALNAFGITSQPLLAQTLPGVMLGAIIAALVVQLQANKGCT